MKTDDLIVLLSNDARLKARYGIVMAAASVVSVAISTILFFSLMGVRLDFMTAIETARFLFKLAFTVAVTVAAGAVLSWIGRPGSHLTRRYLFLLIPPALLVLAVALEMVVMPMPTWYGRMIGHDALSCIIYIPLLAIAPLLLFLLVLRQGAPENAGMAGAVAGLTAAGVGSVLFAIHCDNDSPFFLALWYPLTFAFTTAAGYVSGSRWLRW
jgi:hypothetical protein